MELRYLPEIDWKLRSAVAPILTVELILWGCKSVPHRCFAREAYP
jgi:hypothetical protein